MDDNNEGQRPNPNPSVDKDTWDRFVTAGDITRPTGSPRPPRTSPRRTFLEYLGVGVAGLASAFGIYKGAIEPGETADRQEAEVEATKQAELARIKEANQITNDYEANKNRSQNMAPASVPQATPNNEQKFVGAQTIGALPKNK